MERLKLCRRLGIRMTVAPPVVMLKGIANGASALETRDRNLNIVPLSSITHLRMALKKNIASAKFRRESAPGFPFQSRKEGAACGNRIVRERADESLRGIDARVGEEHA